MSDKDLGRPLRGNHAGQASPGAVASPSPPVGDHQAQKVEALSDAAKCVASAWFSHMSPGKGELTLQLDISMPTPWVQDALAELLAAGFISVKPLNELGGLVFNVLTDCRWAFLWFMESMDNPHGKLPLAELIQTKKQAREYQRAVLASVDRSPKGGGQ